jgi:hypothetical protein
MPDLCHFHNIFTIFTILRRIVISLEMRGMSGLFSRLSLVSILLSSLVLFGCSSSGGDSGVAAPLYSGSTTPAAITQANADEVARKSTEGVNEVVNLTTTGEGIPFLPSAVEVSSSTDAVAQKVTDIALEALDGAKALSLPAAAVMTSDDLNGGSSGLFCGGSVTVPDDFDPNTTTNFSMTFNNLCFDDQTTRLILNGSLKFEQTDTSASITFTNFSVNIDGNQETFSGVFSCDTTMSNCTISTDYAGSDGSIYRLAKVDINGDSFTGYTVGATFYHHQFGQVTITTTLPVTYGGCGIYPSSGIITVSSRDGSSITITFSGCSYSITGIDANSSAISVSGSRT